jgi:hypothetical protein
MVVGTAPAAAGADWLRQGLRLLGRRPLSLPASIGIGFITLALLFTLPAIGPALTALADPLTSLGMLAACRAADAGAIPSIAQYVEGLRQPTVRRQMALLGLINAACLVPFALLVEFTPLGDGLRLVPGPDGQLVPRLDAGMLALQMALMTPLMMARCIAPALVAWHGLPAAKAMFYSFFACWRNRWPLLVFLGGVSGLACGATLVLASLAGLAAGGAGAAPMIFAPMFLVSMTVAQCGLYRMVTQVIEPPAAAP